MVTTFLVARLCQAADPLDIWTVHVPATKLRLL
jgi:hypothetical protein